MVGSLTGCGQDAAGGGAPAPVTSSASAEQLDETGAVPAHPTLPAVVVRGEGEMPPPTDDQRQWFEELTSGDLGGVPRTTIEDVQRQGALRPAFDALRVMPGWAWNDAGAGADGDQAWGGSVAFAGSAPREALDVLSALPVDVRVVQGALLTMYSGQEAPDPAALRERALAAARATTDDPVARDVLDLTITHRDQPVAQPAVGLG